MCGAAATPPRCLLSAVPRSGLLERVESLSQALAGAGAARTEAETQAKAVTLMLGGVLGATKCVRA